MKILSGPYSILKRRSFDKINLQFKNDYYYSLYVIYALLNTCINIYLHYNKCTQGMIDLDWQLQEEDLLRTVVDEVKSTCPVDVPTAIFKAPSNFSAEMDGRPSILQSTMLIVRHSSNKGCK